MTSTVLTGIAQLVTNDARWAGSSRADESPDVARLGIVEDAALVIDGVGPAARVAWVGPAAQAPDADIRRDLGGRAVTPGFVDSHAHLVFDGDRSAEFAARMTGERYDGGGIATTMAATRAADDDRLRRLLGERIAEMRRQGTTTVEVKSGYGLDVANEERALRLAAELTPHTTYLGGHVVPPEARASAADRAAYVELVGGEMLRRCAPHARWADVFCEPNSPHALTGEESREILTAARDAGLGLRVHGNQLGHGPGVRLAVELGAASVDHCTYLSADDVDALVGAADTTVATLLPGVEFSTRSPYPDARALVDAGVAVALATDCNPGTCFISSMPMVMALAVREMGLSPAEALYAGTVMSARALREPALGRVTVGGPAHLAVIDGPSYVHLTYRAGVPVARALEA